MGRTTIILAGDYSEAFKCDKGLIHLANKPMITHVINRVQNIVDEIIVCLKDNSRINLYSQVLSKGSRVIVDDKNFPECLLRGAYTGLLNASGDYSVILPCNTPFVSERFVDLLFTIAVDVNASAPRWPNDYTEPLQAVYRTKAALKTAKKSLEESNYAMQAMITLLKNIRYIFTLVVKEIDSRMHTFININTPLDLKRAEFLIRRGL
ncbi:MAG: molybdenum cofactor guanylyltransferase [Thermoproteota archaeon]